MNTLVAIFIGGGLGSVCRYLVSIMVVRLFNSYLPLGTLSANILSSIIMATGLVYFSGRTNSLAGSMLLIGFCGGFSTFSTFSFETFKFIKNGHYGIALANVFTSIIICVAIFYFADKQKIV